MMPARRIRLEVLADLMRKYQKNGSRETFEKILKRIDGLVCATVNNMKRGQPFLHPISFDDLYQEAVLAVHSAIMAFKPEATPKQVTVYFISHIRRRLHNTYHYLRKEKCYQDIEGHIIDYEKLKSSSYVNSQKRSAPDHPKLQKVFTEVLDIVDQLYEQNEITTAEYAMFHDRVVKQKKFRDIAKIFGISHTGVYFKVKNIIDKVQARITV